jgi:hypothetical protein
MKVVLISMPDVIPDEEVIRTNYEFLNDLEVDASYCQIPTPYPRTRLREYLISEGLVTNSDQLQYAFWYYRQIHKVGWEGRYQKYIHRLEMMNRFPDLKRFKGN